MTIVPRRILGLAAFTFLALSAQAGPSAGFFAFTGGFDSTTLTLQLAGGNVTIPAIARGWVDETGSPNPFLATINYFAGVCGSSDECSGNDRNFHNAFIFDLEGVTGPVISAFLSLDVPSPDGYIFGGPSLTYTMYEVTTSPALLSAGGIPVFNDLGSGVVFASGLATNADEGTAYILNLNASALASINAALGGDWAIGGAIGTEATIPEPSTWLLLSFGLGAIGLGRSRKRA